MYHVKRRILSRGWSWSSHRSLLRQLQHLLMSFYSRSLQPLHISMDRLCNFVTIPGSNKPVSPFQRSRTPTTSPPRRVYSRWSHSDRSTFTIHIVIDRFSGFAMWIQFVHLGVRICSILFLEPFIHRERVSDRILWSAIANQEQVLSNPHHPKSLYHHLHRRRENVPHTAPSVKHTTLEESSCDVDVD